MISPELYQMAEDVELVYAKKPLDKNFWCIGKEYKHPDHLLCIHRELIDFCSWIIPSKLERHLRLLIIRQFKLAISYFRPNCKIICHGSTATGTNLPDGDFDFVVYNEEISANPTESLHKMNAYLKAIKLFKKSMVIEARCPIIKGVEAVYGFNIDIAVGNPNGILNIERHINYFKHYKSLIPLLMFLKIFLVQYHLDQPFQGGISSNTLIQMIIFTIQSIDERYQNHLGHLLLHFFRLFGSSFNYFLIGFTTRNDGCIFKRKDVSDFKWSSPFTLCIQDPQNFGLFLGENSYQCKRLRDECHTAFLKLYRKKIGNEQSILSRLIDITTSEIQTMIEKRKETSKNLHKLFSTQSIEENIQSFKSNRKRFKKYAKHRKNENEKSGFIWGKKRTKKWKDRSNHPPKERSYEKRPFKR